MKKLLIGFLAVLLVVGITTPALAWGHGHRGGGGYRGGWYGGFWPGYGVGAFTGLAIGTLAAPYAYPYPYYAPPPVYLMPAPTCYQSGGYWTQVPVNGGGGYTTYQNVWVPGGTICR